ncbi:serine hydrolase domain-containing protein [Streptomyces celluloflavus]|uniref:Serine hydrolase domain-containing protein n=1 Tax=Streptomyces celluloflavus TaxID=58344 RepID=A0ABW7R779_9ACTN
MADGFASVRDEFAAVAAEEGGDFAAQLVAYRHGERIVDLWTGPEITGDSLLGAFSATKGAAHLIVALLVQDGTLDLDQRVSHYWPEFAAAGKRNITLRELLSHRAGLVGADSGFTLEELSDDRIVAERLGGQRPYWRPGSTFGYHAMVIAALSGEVVRRSTGRTIQEHFAERVRVPYAVDVHLGLPADQESRFLNTQPMLATPERPAALAARATGANSLSGIAFNRNHPRNPEVWELPNFRTVRSLGPASLGGVASARGLARMYAAAISPPDGAAPLLKPGTAAAFAQIHSIGYDLVTREHKADGRRRPASGGPRRAGRRRGPGALPPARPDAPRRRLVRERCRGSAFDPAVSARHVDDARTDPLNLCGRQGLVGRDENLDQLAPEISGAQHVAHLVVRPVCLHGRAQRPRCQRIARELVPGRLVNEADL